MAVFSAVPSWEPLTTSSDSQGSAAGTRGERQDGPPLVGKVASVGGAYGVPSHNAWGILNRPSTGEAMAELTVDGVVASTSLRPLIRPGSRRSTSRCCAQAD